MIEFKTTMDPHSLQVVRDGELLGYLRKHPERNPHFAAHGNSVELSLAEIRRCVARLDEFIVSG